MNEPYEYKCFFLAWVLNIVAMYSKPLLILVREQFKCMCILYIINNPWPSWIERYGYFVSFIYLWAWIHVWCTLDSIRHKIWYICKLQSSWIFCKCSCKEVVFNACIITWECWKNSITKHFVIEYLYLNGDTVRRTTSRGMYKSMLEISDWGVKEGCWMFDLLPCHKDNAIIRKNGLVFHDPKSQVVVR